MFDEPIRKCLGQRGDGVVLLVAEIRAHRQTSLLARLHNKKQIGQIAASIKSFGFNVPILVNAANQMVAGSDGLRSCSSGSSIVPPDSRRTGRSPLRRWLLLRIMALG